MAIRPKKGAMVRFRQSGEKEEKVGEVKGKLDPQFNRHIKTVQYEIMYEGKVLYVESTEIIGYDK